MLIFIIMYNFNLGPDVLIGTQPNEWFPCANETAPFNGDIPDPESSSNFYTCSYYGLFSTLQ